MSLRARSAGPSRREAGRREAGRGETGCGRAGRRRAGGARRLGGRFLVLGGVLGAEAAEREARLPAGFLRADLVARGVAFHRAAAPLGVVHVAVALGAIGALAALDAALGILARELLLQRGRRGGG